MYRLLADFYMRNGWESYGKYNMYAGAIKEFQKGLAIDSVNAEIWYNMGGAYFSNRQYGDALAAWKKTLQLKPSYQRAQEGLRAAMGGQQDPAVPDSDKVQRDKFWLYHH
jgi:tetratricopeptide (TPR) repeat protein